jgi:hypothetical protein
MFDELDQPTFVEVIERPHDTLPTTRTCQSMSPSLDRSIRLKEKHWLSLGNDVTRASHI